MPSSGSPLISLGNVSFAALLRDGYMKTAIGLNECFFCLLIVHVEGVIQKVFASPSIDQICYGSGSVRTTVNIFALKSFYDPPYLSRPLLKFWRTRNSLKRLDWRFFSKKSVSAQHTPSPRLYIYIYIFLLHISFLIYLLRASERGDPRSFCGCLY